MCGISGFWSRSIWPDGQMLALAMARRLAHRGPDGEGVWQDTRHGVVLSHRRLAIQDLSPAGHQPMLSANERFALVYNGELYNHRSLRKTLEAETAGVAWRGHSDTETLLACIAQWGLARTLERLEGMFAIALFDRRAGTLELARDPMGEKPLYVARCGRTVLFGSELSALRAHPAFDARVSREALAAYLARSNVPAPHCIYENVRKLLPGERLCVQDPDDELPDGVRFWSLAEVAEAGSRDPLPGDVSALTDALDDAVLRAVQARLVSDVPIGAFLSGGIDSSLVVAMMQREGGSAARSFSIGFDDATFDEAPHARAVADHLGTEHTELYVTADDAFELLPRLASIYDEPFADSSQIPTALLAALTRGSVTVSLSGDGGDELFGGYDRYQHAPEVWQRLSRWPSLAREGLRQALMAARAPARRRVDGGGNRMANRLSLRLLHAERLRELLVARNCMDVFDCIVTHWNGLTVVREHPAVGPQQVTFPALGSPLQRMMYHDAATYLPDTILTKVDRATMAAGLESRAPLLDSQLVAFAWRLPDEVRQRDGVGKWLLREVLYRHVPKALIERPKKGFGVPLDAWLRGPLRDWAEQLLDERRLRNDGWFDVGLVRRIWDEHQRNEWNWQFELWDVLMFQAWLDEQAA